MAIQNTYTYRGVAIKNAYQRISQLMCVKHKIAYLEDPKDQSTRKIKEVLDIAVQLEIKPNKDAARICYANNVIKFEPDLESADNFMVQAYKKVLALPEYENAKNC